MGQRVQLSASCMLTKSCSKTSKAVFTATMKSCLTSILFAILVCHVGANFPCKPEQIHWNTTIGKRPKCFDCPDCLPGTEPSVPCGTSVNKQPDIQCVSCKLGKTYSDKYDTSQCKACTICSKGKAVKSNCTLTTNTICDSKCGPGFYAVRLISACFPCAQCCGDGKDEFAAECANNRKKCKVRYTPCSRVQTTPSKPTMRNNSTSKPTKRNYSTSKPTKRNYSTSKPAKRNYSTSSTSPTVQTAGDRTTMTLNEGEKSVSGELTNPITPAGALDNEVLKNEKVESGQQGGISVVVILLIIAVAVCVVLSVVIVKRIIPIGAMLRSSREQDSNNEGCNISQRGTPPVIHSSARSSQDSATPLLNRSESAQHRASTPLQTSGAVSSQPANECESPEHNSSTSHSFHSIDSVLSHSNEHESPQPNRSRSVLPQPSEPVSSQPNGSASTHSNKSAAAAAAAAQSNRPAQDQVKSHPGDVTLEELEEKHFPVFERMCKDLNSKRHGDWWDFERLASWYDKISLTDRNSLKNEFQNGGGIPSNTLMSHIKTKYPDHSVRDLVRNLQRIGRDDIAQRLMPYIERKFLSTQGY